MTLSTPDLDTLLKTLQTRFDKHMKRHPGLTWADVQARLDAHPSAWDVLHRMESTGGEPDVIGHADGSGGLVFADCAPESPVGRRSCCYDGKARDARKENKPADSAAEMAAAIGIELLTEAQYRELQQLGEFDLKTSSWVKAPDDIRSLGGGLFCDRRFGRVFTYHNGVQSYYASRGFRGFLVV